MLNAQLEGCWKKRHSQIIKPGSNQKYKDLSIEEGTLLSADEVLKLEGQQDYFHAIFRLTRIADAPNHVPNGLWRLYSLAGLRKTTGFTSPVVNMPHAHLHKILVAESITQLNIETGANILISHLLWKNRVEDLYLSYTVSPIF